VFSDSGVGLERGKGGLETRRGTINRDVSRNPPLAKLLTGAETVLIFAGLSRLVQLRTNHSNTSTAVVLWLSILDETSGVWKMRKQLIAAAIANSINNRTEHVLRAALTAACPLNVGTRTPMSKDRLKLFCLIVGFVALSQTTSMAQSPFLSTVRPTVPILNQVRRTLPTPGLSVSPSSPSSLLAPLYQTPCSAGGSLSNSTATSLRAVPSVFGAQSSFAPC
jgi:hypothetical protein